MKDAAHTLADTAATGLIRRMAVGRLARQMDVPRQDVEDALAAFITSGGGPVSDFKTFLEERRK